MKFTRVHWILSCFVTLLASVVFYMIAIQSKQVIVFFSFAFACGCYSVFSLYQTIVFRKQYDYNAKEDAVLYKTSCPYCKELLAGHELYCPKCNGFLAKQHGFDEDIEE